MDNYLLFKESELKFNKFVVFIYIKYYFRSKKDLSSFYNEIEKLCLKHYNIILNGKHLLSKSIKELDLNLNNIDRGENVLELIKSL